MVKQRAPTDRVEDLPTNHYVDNKKFYEACLTHWNNCKVAAESGKNKPKIPDYIGQCIMDISNKLATSRKFANYAFRDEMVEDAIENCIMYFHNFNPEKFKHPFNYFTTIAYYAFIRRIAREKKQMYIRHKAMFNMVDEGLAETNEYDTNDYPEVNIDDKLTQNEFMNDFVTNYETKLGLNRERNRKVHQEEEDQEQENLTNFFKEDQEGRWEDL